MNFCRSNNQSLKYQRFTPSGWKDLEIRKFEFVAKTQFLYQEGSKLKFHGFKLILLILLQHHYYYGC